jgi:hypothetical protein
MNFSNRPNLTQNHALAGVIPIAPTMEHLSVSCKYCAKILEAFGLPEEEEHVIDLGTVAEILPLCNACPEHTPIILPAVLESDEALVERGETPPFHDRANDTRTIRVYKFPQEPSIDFFIVHDESELSIGIDKRLVYRPNVPSHHGAGILVDESFIDTRLLKRWKKECEENHEECRFSRSLTKSDPVRPLLLIDVLDHCIVDAHSASGEFVALSYCWGVPAPGQPYWFRNEKSILEALRKPGALAPESDFGVKLPRTIRDAIALTQTLGENYLWIDSLCIVQDDSNMKSIELPKMSEIYASACLTIIAGEGNHADHGLSGLTFTRARSCKQDVVHIMNEQLMTPTGLDRRLTGVDSGVTYYTRGWTFQEYRFGRRRLNFEEQSVSWQCRAASWFEDVKDSPGRKATAENLGAGDPEGPGLHELNAVINEYNVRNLGRNEDAFPAFCGYQRVLGRLYPHGFINGMPLLFFDETMSWSPISISMQRRKADKEENNPPSWAWLGWCGLVDVKFNGQRLLEDRVIRSLHVGKLVEWYTMTNLDSPRVPLLSSSQVEDENFSLSREPSLLFCKTQSATFQIRECLYETDFEIDLFAGPWYHIRNASGQWSGILRLHHKEDAEDSVGKSVELVAISTGYAPEEEPKNSIFGLLEWSVKERPKHGSEYHYYNVLWIERSGDIAYRKAIGRIEKAAWEGSNLGQVDLTLG